jgi:hypothetical protein
VRDKAVIVETAVILLRTSFVSSFTFHISVCTIVLDTVPPVFMERVPGWTIPAARRAHYQRIPVR